MLSEASVPSSLDALCHSVGSLFQVPSQDESFLERPSLYAAKRLGIQWRYQHYRNVVFLASAFRNKAERRPDLAVSITAPDCVVRLWNSLRSAMLIASNESSVWTDANDSTNLDTWNDKNSRKTLVTKNDPQLSEHDCIVRMLSIRSYQLLVTHCFIDFD